MDIITGTQATLAGEMMNGLARFRYRIFVEMLGWDLPCRDGLELDQFDREDTVYLVARKDAEVVGTARLLPTHRPYLLGEVFPQLMGQQPLPKDPAVWELSRFTAVDLDAGLGQQVDQRRQRVEAGGERQRRLGLVEQVEARPDPTAVARAGLEDRPERLTVAEVVERVPAGGQVREQPVHRLGAQEEALAHQRQRHVRERGQVATGTHASLAGHPGHEAGVEAFDDLLH